MFYKTKGNVEERKKSYSIILSSRDKRILLIGFTLFLVILAIALLILSGVKKSPLQECESIVLQQPRESCIANLAFSTHNATMCGMLKGEGSAYSCIEGLAESTNSIALCNSIANLTLKNECIYHIALNTSNQTACSLLSGQLLSNCFYNFSQKENFANMSICTKIQNLTLMQKCRYINVYHSALDTLSYKYCLELPNTTNGTVLSYILSANASSYENLEIAFEATNFNITPQEYCILQIVNKTRNETLCNSTGGIASSICKGLFVSYSKNVTINETVACGNVPSYLKSICEYSYITSQAISKDNLSICKTIDNETYMDQCIFNLAYKYNNTSYCAYIKNATAMSACYYTVK
ncbi:MAG: hypothetical protein ACP5SA_01905 [Candidatus Micrarchaeia archaeon]